MKLKLILTRIKPFLRWFIWGGVLFFLIETVKERFAEVAAVSLEDRGWFLLSIALFITIAAHVWSGWVWTWILAMFDQHLGVRKGIRVYLLTNIAKYSPGNIWHFWGRIIAVTKQGGSKGVATVSVLLEPLLMAAAALSVGSVGGAFSKLQTNFDSEFWLPLSGLIAVAIAIHPRILNATLSYLGRSKNKVDTSAVNAVRLERYPIVPFLGEIGFVIFRGIGFILTFAALQSITWQQLPQLFKAFSFAWLLGLIVPGAPGGLGVFEVTAFGLLDNSQFPTEIVAVALYRLISILAEAIAALFSLRSSSS